MFRWWEEEEADEEEDEEEEEEEEEDQNLDHRRGCLGFAKTNTDFSIGLIFKIFKKQPSRHHASSSDTFFSGDSVCVSEANRGQ